MEEYYVGQIALFAGNFIPLGFYKCDGAEYKIVEHTMLFSLLGNRFGGDGSRTFCVPDLGEGVLMGAGKISEEEEYKVGEKYEQMQKIITNGIMPVHDHGIRLWGYSGKSTETEVEGNCLASKGREKEYSIQSPTGYMHEDTIKVESAGNGEPINNAQPSLVMYHCICYEGYYPARG